MRNKNGGRNRSPGLATVICHQRHQKLWRLLAVPLFLLLSGFSFDEATYYYPNGLSIYNYMDRDNPSQIFAFENVMPPVLENATINGIPIASYQRMVTGGSPVKRGQGRILAITWYWTEHYDIRFTYKSVEFRLPLNDFQRLQVFGRPKHVDRKRASADPMKPRGQRA